MQRPSKALVGPWTLVVMWLFTFTVSAQIHQHGHEGHELKTKAVQPPRVFLDKSPRIVQYQLDRLDNERLLLVERKTDNAKYAPVFTAILTRAGMSPQYREEALAGLVELHQSDAATELLQALATVGGEDRQQRRTARQLAGMLLRQPQATLRSRADDLLAATRSDNSLTRAIGYAGLIAAGQSDTAWRESRRDAAATRDWLASASLVPTPNLRSELRDRIVSIISDGPSLELRRAAIEAIAFVPNARDKTFRLVAPFVSNPELRDAAVRTLLTIPTQERNATSSRLLLDELVRHAERTPAEARTTDRFIDAMQLADQLLARVPVDAARVYRERLRAVMVRVVRIHTVEEEMRYDTPYFAVEAGRPVQVILQNEDLMPHNIVVTVPGALQEVAELGLAVGPKGGSSGKQYVPDSEKVLHATDMVQPGKQARLTFTAPAEPGEYPYVCTFPRHWMRMYGVMVVVADLDGWLQNPIEPKDPIGSNRSFVQSWTVDDLKDELEPGLRGRTPEIGHRIFTEATCAQCHKLRGQGGAVGPELTDVFKRWKGKGDDLAVLREILDPSHRIDPKYAVQLVVTTEGEVLSGIVVSEDKMSVSMLVNPESPKPTVIKRSNIDEMVKTSKSMMPKALLDRFTKDEIFELLALLKSATSESE